LKTPGVLYRISFLVILNSIFVFAAVTIFSTANNQAKIDRLVSYKFDFVTRYLRAELKNFNQDSETSWSSVEARRNFHEIFGKASQHLKGLTGLALLTAGQSENGYKCRISRFRGILENHDREDLNRIVTNADFEAIKNEGIQISERFESSLGRLVTIYVPCQVDSPDNVLAVSFKPAEIVGSDNLYNWTIVALFLVSTLITLLIINLLFRRFIKPFNRLVNGLQKSSEGSLVKVAAMGNDEIGRAASSLNIISDTLWKNKAELSHVMDQLSETNRDLVQSEAFLSKMIQNAPFGVIATDLRFNVLIFSQSALKLFGVTPEEAHCRKLTDYFPHTPEKIFPTEEQKLLGAKEEMLCTRQNGDKFPALVMRAPIRENGVDVSAYLFIIRDITDSQGFTDMIVSIDRMFTRGVMAGEIAHEINNYLAVILGNVELIPLLLAKGKMDKVQNKLDVLKSTVGRIQKFANGLMGYSDEEAVIEMSDLNQLIGNLVAFLTPQNRYDNIEFHLALSPRLPLVPLDEKQMQQMLINLLNNAADALHEKPDNRQIEITTIPGPENDTVRITIKDNAGGLPEDIHDVIFQSRYTGQRRGRGFGLFIVKQIIDKHHARIAYDSIPDDGTMFTITLPLKIETLEETEATPAADYLKS